MIAGGGHIAEVLDKRTGVSPLWIPPWPSIEPAAFDPQSDSTYGNTSEARLLAGIMGHNLCLDIFGGPSTEEEAAGLHPHGEASIALYDIEPSAIRLTMRAQLAEASLEVERHIELQDRNVRIVEVGGKHDGDRSPGGLDRARHARSAVPGARRDGVSRLGDPLESAGGGVRHSGLPGPGG